mgnify:CR=1 FL=1
MPIITPKVFVEGDKTNPSDIDSIDESWDAARGNLDSSNIREEGVDRRVIKSATWAESFEKAGPSYFYSNGQADLDLPYHKETGPDGMRVFDSHASPEYRPYPGAEISFSKPHGGMDEGAGTPKIRCSWEVNKTAAIIVRCSFRLTWHCSEIGDDRTLSEDFVEYPETWAEYYGKPGDPPLPYPVRTIARSPIELFLTRKEFTKDVDDGSIGTAPGILYSTKSVTPFHEEILYKGNDDAIKPIARVQLGRLFATWGGALGYPDAVTNYDGDLRSNVNVPITLIDVITPENIWNNDINLKKHFEDGSNDIFDFEWELRYNHTAYMGHRALFDRIPRPWEILNKLRGAELHDINFYTQKFNR